MMTSLQFDKVFEILNLKRWLSPWSKLIMPALTLPFSSVFFDSFSITLLYSSFPKNYRQKSPTNEVKLK